MIMDSTSVKKREVLHLVDFQIEILKQQSSLDSSELHEYQARSDRILELYEELDRVKPSRVLPECD